MEKRRHKRIAVFFDSIINICVFLSGFLLVFTTLSVCLEVVMRYFLKRPLTWVDEITEYTLRSIAQELNTDTAFMFLSGLQSPDFRTICLFRADHTLIYFQICMWRW